MEPIAIVGFAFRLPGSVNDIESLMDILEQGRDLMGPWPDDRINLAAFYSPDNKKLNSLRSKGGHFLEEHPGLFDAPFFSITAEEARAMDPQQRIMLETSYLALENAGMPLSKVAGSQTAVYEASMVNDYGQMTMTDTDTMPRMTATGIANAILPNRVSWYFNFLGPSMHVDTACSGSLVGVDLACTSLRSRDCSMALVAGSNLMLSPETSLSLSKMNFLSPDSRCHSFDARANGYARGEGIIVVILKRLSDAVRDKDTVRALIRSSGANQDGHTPGLTQPSSLSQERLIRSVYQKAGLELGTTRYIEAHGTGTPAGDPAEIQAIGRVFRSKRTPEEPLYVGSIKANIGHLEGGSGLAGLLKSTLMLERGTILPVARLETINPDLDNEFYNIAFPTRSIEWPCGGIRRISINSFGFGGTNAHIVLDDAYNYFVMNQMNGLHCTLSTLSPYPSCIGNACMADQMATNLDNFHGKHCSRKNFRLLPLPKFANGEAETHDQKEANDHCNEQNSQVSERARNNPNNHSVANLWQQTLLVWSASDEEALKRMIKQYSVHYCDEAIAQPGLRNKLAHTLAMRRSNMLWRSFAILSPSDAPKSLQSAVSKPYRSSRTGLAFVFTGQGAQYSGMGSQLLLYPIFSSTIRKIDALLSGIGSSWSIYDQLENRKAINHPRYSQPICTALQIALFELLKDFGIVPSVVIGHSSGEIAAAYSVGAISLQSAIVIAFHRGVLAEKLSNMSPIPGAMMSVNLSSEDMRLYLDKHITDDVRRSRITIACINSPVNITLSGDEKILDSLKQRLDEDNIFAQKLNTGIAYHSPTMEAIANEYRMLLSDLPNDKPKPSSTTMVSTVLGAVASTSQLSEASYWVRNLVSSVQFYDALRIAIDTRTSTSRQLGLPRLEQIYDLVEIGPHPALRRPCMDIVKSSKRSSEIRYNSTLSRNDPSPTGLLRLLGTLFTYGYPVDISRINTQLEEHDGSYLVDAPPYPFDRTQLYWHETRLSYDYRLKSEVPRDVLGSRVRDWNPLQPRWRKIIDIEELPWVRDHMVSGNPIYPATGMLVMAIEAVRQSIPETGNVLGFFIKEAEFKSPITLKMEVDGGRRTEAVISLSSVHRAFEKQATWFRVSIVACSERVWTECFTCTLRVETSEAKSSVDGGRERKLEHEAALSAYKEAANTCTRPVQSEEFYRYCSKRGITYGPAFSILQDIRGQDGCTAIGQVDVSRPEMDYEGVVHPAIIDAACQVCWIAPTHGLMKNIPTEIPRRLHDTYVAASGWKPPQTSHIRIVSSSSEKPNSKRVEGSIIVLADDGSLLAKVGHLELVPIADDHASQASRSLLHGIDWRPALSSVDNDRQAIICQSDAYVNPESHMLAYNRQLQHVLCLAMKDALKDFPTKERLKAPAHMQKYISWIERVVTEDESLASEFDGSDQYLERSLLLVEAQKPDWAVYFAVARNLPGILRGEIDPLQLLFSSDELAERLYADIFASICDHRFSTFLGLVSHETPTIKILEVGAGSGGFTHHVLSSLVELEQQHGGTRFSRYVYTDISPGYFDKARIKFEKYATRIEYRVLDLEQDIAAQGFDLETFDLVIAGSVLHTTRNLSATLVNIRKAMKPAAKLIFFEITGPCILALQFGFGPLAGWWNGTESWRVGDQNQVTSEEQWNDLLLETGFSGNDVVFRDYPSQDCHSWSIIASTASHDVAKTDMSRVVLLCDKSSVDQMALVHAIREGPMGSLYDFEIRSLNETSSLSLSITDGIIILYEIGQSLLESLTEREFTNLRCLIQSAWNILWVTSRSLDERAYSSAALSTGFLRTIRSEMTNRRIVNLSLEDSCSDITVSARAIGEVFQRSLDTVLKEVEYIFRDRDIMIGRLIEEKDANDALNSIVHPSIRYEKWCDGPPLKFDVGRPGTLDTLRFIEDDVAQQELDADQIEIAARAWGLSFRDVFIALGRLEEDDFGLDAAGYITKVGSNCQSFKPGDRVVMLKCGLMRQYARSHRLEVIKIPDSMTFEDAASVPGPAATAYYCLVKIARLKKGERVLIHSAAGATGQLMVQMAQWIGAEVFVSVSNHEKKAFLTSVGVEEDHIFYSRDTTFAQGIRRMTNEHGVDVVVNSLSGEKLQATWECMAPFGRFIEIGKSDINENSSLPMGYFRKNVSFHAVDLRHFFSINKEIVQELLVEMTRLISCGIITFPEPRQIFSVSEIEDAYRSLQSGRHTGRIVISNQPADIVPKFISTSPKWHFHNEASYMIAGGLGGIGRGICRWMMQKGVKNLILPSRSGPSTQAAVTLLQELREHGVTVHAPICDVSLRESVSKLISDCSATMPPIAGCINAAMTLQDSVFDNMTFQQWQLAIRSKVDTSNNLADLLPRNLDFFILLSSISGVYGNLSQSNYAAGNTFQDALARYRTSHGEKALSINVGWMRTIGIMSEKEEYRNRWVDGAELAQIEEEELMAILEIYCDPSQPVLHPSKSQLLLGTITPATLQKYNLAIPDILKRPLFSSFSTWVGDPSSSDIGTEDLTAKFNEAASEEDRADVVIKSLAQKLARSLSMSADDVDTSKPLFEYGVDSLVAVEVRNWIGKEFSAEVAVFDIMGGASIDAVGVLVSERSTFQKKC